MIGSFKLSGLVDALQGELQGVDVEFTRVSTDTRSLQNGDLFVALKGANFDGDSYVAAAAKKGACAAIVGRYSDCALPQLRVADTTQALGRLAKLNRCRSAARVVAITGSQGKTTVKEMIGRILSESGSTLMTQGNLNNAIGVPLTLLRLEERHQLAVIELGANGPGEIAWTSSLVQPDVAVISNAAGTHLEGFGSLNGVVKAKGEIIDGLKADGVAVLNMDDPHFDVWKKRAASKRVASFSIGNPHAQYRAEAIDTSRIDHTRFTLVTPKGKVEISLALPGRHNVANAVAAAAAALEAGAEIQQVVDGLTAMSPVKGRMFIIHGFGNSTLIDDSYNASPSSFKAAIQVLSEYPGKKVLVAGDMAELGSEVERAHQDIGRLALEAGIDSILTIGVSSRLISAAGGDKGRHFVSMDELADYCRTIMDKSTTVLVKGSRSSGMDKVVEQLKTHEVT